MEQIMNYVKPELIVVAIVLYFVGMGLKSAHFPISADRIIKDYPDRILCKIFYGS